jgi:hypothetical protein
MVSALLALVLALPGAALARRVSNAQAGILPVASMVAGVRSASSASAQDLEPRACSNLPIGLNFLLGGYGYSTGGLATDSALPIRDDVWRSYEAVPSPKRRASGRNLLQHTSPRSAGSPN